MKNYFVGHTHVHRYVYNDLLRIIGNLAFTLSHFMKLLNKREVEESKASLFPADRETAFLKEQRGEDW